MVAPLVPSNPLISVLIVSYNVKPLLQACLKRLLLGPHVDGFEVIVVDNASVDGTQAMLAQSFPQVQCLALPENLGFSAALNRAAQQARGRQYLLLNPDTEVDGQQLLRMARILEQLPGAWAVGFAQTDATGFWQLAHGQYPTLWQELQRKCWQHAVNTQWLAVSSYLHRRYQTHEEVAWVAGSCCMVWAEAYWLVGGFDPGYFLYFEDIDFCLKIGALGGKVYFSPEVVVIHHRGQSAKQRPKMATMAYRSSQQRFINRYGPSSLRQLWLAYARLRASRMHP